MCMYLEHTTERVYIMKNKYKLGFRVLGKWVYNITVCTDQQLASLFLIMTVSGCDKMSIEVVERDVEED